ncbi:MAG TPA: MlaD family protein [Solirubrobacteraceae bacterium]|nr:MlaD family protein [Solirubrobacteraceae bacterium]
MAATSPPAPPTPPPGRPPVAPVVRAPSRSGRMLAAGALVVVVLLVAVLVLGGGGGADYALVLPDAGQLVNGDQVQVGGVPVGTVKKIELTPQNKARVTIHVNSSLTPLHTGTTVQIRVPSLSGVANRYIALTPGPNNHPSISAGSTLPTSDINQVVDIDQLFNIFNAKTRQGLKNVVQGSAAQYQGAGPQLNTSTKYFNPALTATDHLFAELTRDQQVFTSFLVESSKALTTIAAHKDSLSSLIGNANTTFKAIGDQQTSFGQGLKQLPVALQQGNKTFAQLVPTLAALRQLVDVSKPNTKTLGPFFARLRPLLSEATPVLHNLSQAVTQPGSNNDLTDAAFALPGLAKALSSGSPHAVDALRQSVPVTAFFGPYSPELQGFVRDFGQGASYYDANGHYARITPAFDDFTLDSNNNLTPTDPAQGLAGLRTSQLRRCPGSGAASTADGSAPFTDAGQLSCDPTQKP